MYTSITIVSTLLFILSTHLSFAEVNTVQKTPDSLKQAGRTIVYCFPGQGADHRLFDSLRLDSSYAVKIIEYGTPDEEMDLRAFARELSRQIDTTEKFCLLGVSLGGMICVELNEMLDPQKTIIISSAKNRSELPLRYRFQKRVPLYNLFSGRAMLTGAKILQPIVEPDRNNFRETFKSMLGAKKPAYMKRTVDLIINWSRESNSKKVYQIHGSIDKTIPLRNIKNPDYIVKNGSHMMTLTRGSDVSRIVNAILSL